MGGTSHPLSVTTNNHAITGAAAYANIAARDADTSFFTTTTNKDKIIRIDSPLSYYVLGIPGASPTWIEFTTTTSDQWTELTDTPAAIPAGLVIQGNAGGTALEGGQNLNTTASPTFADLTLTGGDLTITGVGTSATKVVAANVLTVQPQALGTATIKLLKSSGADALTLNAVDGGSNGISIVGAIGTGNLLIESQAGATYAAAGFVNFDTDTSDITFSFTSTKQAIFIGAGNDDQPLLKLVSDGSGGFEAEKRFFVGTRSPEGAVTGNPGDEYGRASGVNSSIYIHRGATSGNTGWFDIGDGAGDVFKVGTPVDNQVGIWTGDGTLEGSTNLTFDGSILVTPGQFKGTTGASGASAAFLASSGAPSYGWDHSIGAVDNRIWDITGASSALLFRVINDAANVATAYMKVIRSGTTINTIEFISSSITTTGNITIAGALDMTSGLINNVLDPVSAQDAATKNYVDTKSHGNVFKVGTPVDNQVGIWTGDGTLEGETGLTFDGSVNKNLTILGIAPTQNASLTIDGFLNSTFNMRNNGSASNNQRWRSSVSGSTMSHQLMNDALTTGANYVDITRSLNVATSIAFTTPTLSTSGDLNVTGQVKSTKDGFGATSGVLLSSISASIGFNQTDGPADGKVWDIRASGDTLTMSSVNDANTFLDTFMNVSRSGLDITTVSFPNGLVSIGEGLSMNSTLISNVLDPVSAQDAATKNYVDTSNAQGFVTKIGTPIDNQVGIWTGDGTLEGLASLSYVSTILINTGQIQSTKTGGGTTAAFLADSTQPAYTWRESDQLADEMIWDIVVQGGNMDFNVLNQVEIPTNFLRVNRGTGATITDIAFTTPLLTTSGDFIANGTGTGATTVTDGKTITVKAPALGLATIKLEKSGSTNGFSISLNDTDSEISMLGGTGTGDLVIVSQTKMTLNSLTDIDIISEVDVLIESDSLLSGLIKLRNSGADTLAVFSATNTGSFSASKQFFVGTRDPNGNVTGNPGDEYSRVSGVNSSIFVHKGAAGSNSDWGVLSGTVTNTGTLTDNSLVRGNGGVDIDVGNITMSSDGNDLTIPGNLTIDIDTLIVDGTADTISINGSSALAGLTIFQHSAQAKRGILLTGDGYFGGALTTDGVFINNILNTAGNMQIGIGQFSDYGDVNKNIFRYTVGIGIPNVGGVSGNGSVNRHINLGNELGSRVGIGIDVFAAQSAVQAQAHIHANTGTIGLIVQPRNAVTDIMQIRNAAGTATSVVTSGDFHGFGTPTPSIQVHVSSADVDTRSLFRLESTLTNGAFSEFGVGDRDPNTFRIAAGGAVHIRASGATSGSYESLEATTGTTWFKRSLQPATDIEILTSEQLEALASGGVITISVPTNIRIKANITTSSRFSVNTGITLVITTGSEPFSLTYSGTGDFFSGAGTVRVRAADILSSSTGTLVNISDGSFGLENTFLSGWDTLGTVAGGTTFLLRFCTFISVTTGFTLTDMSSTQVLSVRHAGAGIAKPFFTWINKKVGANISLRSVPMAMTSAGSVIDISTNLNDLAPVTVEDVSFSVGNLFKKTTVAEVAITAVADASIANGTITAMADNSDSGTTISSTATYFDGEVITISGTTSYNGTFRIFNVVASTSFDIQTAFVADDATGTTVTERIGLTVAVSHGIVAADSLKIKDTNFYNGFNSVLIAGATLITINGNFISTNTGNIQRDVGLDQSDPRVRGNFNPTVVDSHSIACAHVNDNSTANGSITNNAFTDIVFGTAGSALLASSTMERWKLINELNGSFEYIGLEPFDGLITFDFTVLATAEQDFRFKWAIDTGSGFGDLPDDVESLVNLKDTGDNVTKTFPLAAVKGDIIKPQLTRNAGSAGITTTYASIYATG